MITKGDAMQSVKDQTQSTEAEQRLIWEPTASGVITPLDLRSTLPALTKAEANCLSSGALEAIEQCNALVIRANYPTRLWDTEVDGYGYTPYLYFLGGRRQMMINIDGDARVRPFLNIDPSFTERDWGMYAPMTHDDCFEQPAAWPFVRFHIEGEGRAKIAVACANTGAVV